MRSKTHPWAATCSWQPSNKTLLQIWTYKYTKFYHWRNEWRRYTIKPWHWQNQWTTPTDLWVPNQLNNGLIKFLSNIDTKVMLEDNAANLIDNYLQLHNYTVHSNLFVAGNRDSDIMRKQREVKRPQLPRIRLMQDTCVEPLAICHWVMTTTTPNYLYTVHRW